MRSVAVVALLTLACSSRVDEPLRALETRLRPIALTSDDGLHVTVGIHDVGLGIACAPKLAADGALRCLPRTQGGAFAEEHAFVDAGCTRPAVIQDPGFDFVDGYGLADSRDRACGGAGARVMRVKRVEQVFSNESGVCVPSESGWPAYEIVGEVPPASFVALSRVVAGRFNADAFAGDDGSQITLTFSAPTDEVFGVPCEPMPAADGRERCLPAYGASTAGFADPSCSVLALQRSDCLARPLFVRGDTSAGPVHVFDVGARLPRVYSPRTQNACVETDSPVLAFAVGPEVAASSFALVEPAIFGGSRLHVRAMAIGGSLFADLRESERFIDAATDTPCELAPVAEEEERCVPFTGSARVVYLDEFCHEPAAEIDPLHPPKLAYEFRDGFLAAAYVVPDKPAVEVHAHEWTNGECHHRDWKTNVVPVSIAIPFGAFPRVSVTRY